ncbi:MAG TPA: 50S ribosomal protein L29 [Candidatus Pacearchaeota archaeon]|nr:50S ribosomal protein L29 [Candidatus Pacearchaeota archaeon]
MDANELRQKTQKELIELLEVSKKKIHELNFDLTLGKLKKTGEIKENKKNIARILTLLNSKK